MRDPNCQIRRPFQPLSLTDGFRAEATWSERDPNSRLHLLLQALPLTDMFHNRSEQALGRGSPLWV